ncbi:flagellin [Shimia sp. MIT1388]|uniref:flagellin N-terminal helical domain-containing protein n=1 Tax=Shimia sp. MIT1388 TaxID=3096992 RepID=UPI00399BF392
MSSILTNNGAMVALQTLKSVNSSLSDTTSAISTGKKVANAKQNAAVWAISKTMESDVNGFKSVKESLSLGESTVAVARNATETVTDLLGQMKERIVAAQGDNVDRTKLQAEVSDLRDQIGSVVGAAQFNGLNLVSGTGFTDVLSSLDRDNTGAVSASSIRVNNQDLSTGGYVNNDVFAAGGGGATVSANGDTFVASVDAGAQESILIQEGAGGWNAGDTVSISIGDQTASYTLTAEDAASTTAEDIVAIGLKSAIESLGTGVTVDYDSGTNPGELLFDNTGTEDVSITGSWKNAGSGGLAELANIDVSTLGGAQAALGAIEGLITTSIDAAAAFGTVESRISTQNDFVSKLSDSLTSGIGSMVDADMEETSARLQALQVQQQLATQSLSIANQAPQQLLSLFR